MRYFGLIIILLYGMLWVYYKATEEPEPAIPESEAVLSYDSDPNRKVIRFDWKTWKYLYKDEMPYRGDIDLGPLTSYPDLFIQSQGTMYHPDNIIIGTQRYVVRIRNNNAILTPTR